MTWLDDKGCGNCDNCGMDMEMEPFCVDGVTLTEAEMRLGRSFPYGLNINTARTICGGHRFVPRIPIENL